MVVYFNRLGWRQHSLGAVSQVAGQELSTVTTSVKMSLTQVFMNYELWVLQALFWIQSISSRS